MPREKDGEVKETLLHEYQGQGDNLMNLCEMKQTFIFGNFCSEWGNDAVHSIF